MGITLFSSALTSADEEARSAAVESSGALHAIDHPAIALALSGCREALATTMACVSIIYQDCAYVIAGIGIPTGPYGRRSSFCSHAILRPDGLFVVGDAEEDELFAANPNVTGTLAVRFYAGSVIRFAGQPIGALCAFDPEPRAGIRPHERSSLIRASDSVGAYIAQYVGATLSGAGSASGLDRLGRAA